MTVSGVSAKFSFFLYLYLVLINKCFASYILHVQYFKQPSEYAIFHVSSHSGKEQWTTYVHMNKTRSWKEDEVLSAIRPVFDGPSHRVSYQANWITRHIGVQFSYVLSKFTFDQMIFENLCSQMKPKFGGLLANSTQRPSKLEFVVEHPSSMFTLPEGFRISQMGREEIRIRIGGRAILDGENLYFDSIVNTKSLIIEHGDELRSLMESASIMSLKCESLLIQGKNKIESEHIRKFAKEWSNMEREVKKWEIHIDQEEEPTDSNEKWTYNRESSGLTLEIRVEKGRVLIETF